ncbi:hypothetical protein BKG83_10220 [Mycobacteroides chelonae]|jgi:hypothetical protein|uniref:hypothetical protein n=1 Tax=Mycobacteroides chelonae TaxID=1774 RepID=UPI0008A8B09A|nr:hypothetical protein [Mycobacteroides chelonae]PKQ59614.1 hypothetical protein B5566_01770 [Mycobacterium sp. MHSD3]SKM87722.1 Uncharacterised protein [Mycobacteroides abscessus subsp. bolletii]MBF9520838.1 hypothetical protein [Mycobacteroides chelonae]OHU54759.1 hypothetical protein BKG83_10220 [Mycobacteroides chelonae]GLE56465.1 hypothetical protein NJBCHELONAE_17740 [Mycobacteroides chelonae]
MTTESLHIIAAADEGGGAALDQVIGMSVAATIVSGGLLWIGYLHRQRRITWLQNLADKIGNKFNRPPWVALQICLFVSTIVAALFGFIWDVSLHIGKGRDAGPLANPAHYFILFGLFLLFIAGTLAIVLPYDRPGSAAVRITRTWYAPVGGLLMAMCGLYALIGFPLDDIWHRIFGQDVTLWGPTHLMLIGGAGLSLVSVLILEYEGRRAIGFNADDDTKFVKFLRYLSFGGLFIGLSVFQIEYDFGVEQFRLVQQPMMIAAAAAFAAVCARTVMGRGAAIIGALLAIVLRAAVSLLAGPILGGPTSWFALYLGPALVVELIALTPLIKRPILFGAIAGLGVGTAGLWLESLWIGAVYRYPWPLSMWPEALAMSVPAAIAMGVCGALLGMVLTGQKLPKRSVSITAVVLTVLVLGAAVANGLRTEVPEHATATITLNELSNDGGKRMVSADVVINPRDLISDDPEWVTILSWQGGLANDHGLAIDRLQKISEGHYRSTQPIPVYGSWKTLLRVQDGTTMTGVPIFLPADPGIGAPETPALTSSTRPFTQELTILQRERNQNHPSWLFNVASLVVLFCTLVLIAALSWGAGRINGTETRSASDALPTPDPKEPVSHGP